MRKSQILAILILLLLFSSCKEKNEQGKWIKGTPKQQLEMIEWQFRGFDKAMVETDHRYQELYFAGKDQNWEYADYSNKKIKKALKTGFQRRPKREKSAKHFLEHTLPEMDKAIKSKDTVAFINAFDNMTQDCNACHALDKMSFFMVKTPLQRQTSIRK